MQKFAKFVLVGALNSIVGYVLYVFFIYLGLHYALSVLLATIIGIIFNFRTIGGLVFQNSDWTLIARFAGVYGVTYVLNIAALKLLDGYQVNLYIAGIVVLPFAATISYLLNSRCVFREQR